MPKQMLLQYPPTQPDGPPSAVSACWQLASCGMSDEAQSTALLHGPPVSVPVLLGLHMPAWQDSVALHDTHWAPRTPQAVAEGVLTQVLPLQQP
jgi:hypothetical protein